jgi:hypothetical protein
MIAYELKKLLKEQALYRMTNLKDTNASTDVLEQIAAKLRADLQENALSQITTKIVCIYLKRLNEI